MTRFLFIVLLLTLGACRVVEVPQGRVPAEYLERVQPYMGSYQGKFQNRKGTLVLKLEGDLAVAEFVSPEHGDDILGRGCGSKIGLLKTVTVSQRQQQITDAAFELDPAGCRFNVAGRRLMLSFKIKNGAVTGVSASVFKEQRTRWETECFPRPDGGMSCHRRPENDDVYLYGSFKK